MCLSTNNDEVILGTHATTIRYTPLSAQLRSSSFSLSNTDCDSEANLEIDALHDIVSRDIALSTPPPPTLFRLLVPRAENTFEPRRVRWLRLVRPLLVREPPRQSAREDRPGRRIKPRRQISPQGEKKIHVVEDLSCADNGVYLIVVACVPKITSSLFVLKHTWRSSTAKTVFLSPDSSKEARIAAGLGTPPFPPPLPLLPLLTIEAKSGVLLSGLDHVLLQAGSKEAFPTGLDNVDVVANAAGNASLLPTPRRTWSKPGSKIPDFASIVSNERSGSGGRKGGVPRPAAVRVSSLLSGERKTGLAKRQVCLSTNNGAAAASSGRPKRGFRAFFSCVKTHDT